MIAPQPRPTLNEVAARAGVGRGTASRVINGQAKVSEQAREAVERAIAELGYVPNRAARALKTQRTDAVALVIAESEERVFGEPFFAGIVRGIGAALGAAGRQLVLLLAQASERRGTLDEFLTRQHVDGVLLLSLHDDDQLPGRIREHGLPVVVGGRANPALETDFVDVDNVQGARLAVEHLVGSGHRRIATIAGPPDMVAGHSRYEGYAAALEAAGLPVDEALVAHGDFGQASGESAMRALLERSPAPDAVFCANDLMAAGALRALNDAGVQVPEDIAVVGFEDAPIAASTHPPLTTVHQSPEEMGREMVAMLLAAMADPTTPRPGRMLPTRLVVRASS
ncbi:substrate-binding domain-containing protein [Nocardioides sp. MAH-18]|uniref:Substrate-binding domain-containing protein n=1 Tax=Nocardioides agri TaxID=2682843 RepID=A0A6L6XPS7_9ACTN|nr:MULTISPECIES: LacI family DNA-binding transcriptional regulator [unclassified Nocardioides]MBA2954423.1 LacI family DNA-binding transcriptional regulator [Nocardioides sp. CGMCC 1.13656]MVQ49284.1 substrate-binding domain-containing protein [Nocardioides sp. MAH-18]